MNTCNCPTEAAPSKELHETIHRPQFRIHEDANGPSISIALPGVRKEDLKLTLHEASLRIEAPRHDADSPQHYRLDLRLTARLDGTKTTATLDAGVLTLQVPVRDEAKPRQIAVN